MEALATCDVAIASSGTATPVSGSRKIRGSRITGTWISRPSSPRVNGREKVSVCRQLSVVSQMSLGEMLQNSVSR